MVLACCACASALDPSLDISQYAHTSWKVREGFTKGYIGAIAQTPDGYLWLGTPLGLFRFDGVRAVPWQPTQGQQLPSDAIRKLLVGRDGTLWIGTSNGIASWKDGKLAQHPKTAGITVQHLMEDHEGTIWMAGEVIGESPVQPRLCEVQRGEVQCWGRETFTKRVDSIHEDSKHNLWVAGPEDLWRWKAGAAQRVDISKDVGRIYSLTEDENGTLILGVRNGLRQFVDGKVQNYMLPGVRLDFTPRHFLHASDGSLWIATLESGVMRVHRGKADWFFDKDGLTSNGVSSIFEDGEGNVWVGTSAGLDRFRDYAVPTISNKQGLAEAYAGAVVAATDGGIWAASFTGVTHFKNGQVTVYSTAIARTPGSHSQAAQTATSTIARWIKDSGLLHTAESLLEDHEGKIWVTSSEGIVRWDGNRFSRVPGVPGGGVFGMAEDSRQTVWLNNEQHGFVRVPREGEVQAIPWSGLGRSDFGLSMAVDPQGGVWVGFVRGGIVHWKDGQVRGSYTTKDGLGNGRVRQLRFGTRGTLWAATQGGLSRIKDGRLTTLTTKNGLPCDALHWSAEDIDHDVWLFMPCGLVHIARTELDAWVADPKHKVQNTVYDVTDGVRLTSLTGGFGPTVSKAPDGKIWFSVIDGISVIDPQHLAFNKLPPPVRIEQVTADDTPYDAKNGMRLPPRVHYLSIDYTALSLTIPEKVRFRYKLEGADTNWREVVNDREVQYTNLAPGNYRFRVLASNNSGVWNEEGATLDFVIPPMWYQTNWFRVACLAAFALLLWALYRLRVRQLAYQFNMRLEERVSERTRIARDLHDTLLQSFQALLPRLQAAIYKLPESAVEARKTLEVAVDQASEAITEGRDAVQGLRASTVEQNDLALAIRTVGEELASAENNRSSPEFNVVVEGTSRNLHPILRDEVYRLAAEALRNAFRHAAAQKVEVEIRYDERHFRLRVRDDGKGIGDEVLRAEEREGHYGLPGMKERAGLVGGKLTIWSEVDNGTEIELVIPASRAYAQPTRRLWKFGKRSPQHVDVKETINRE
jgi:signal transduction histidine kinase/ligand-binding sensor domain-containing protein